MRLNGGPKLGHLERMAEVNNPSQSTTNVEYKVDHSSQAEYRTNKTQELKISVSEHSTSFLAMKKKQIFLGCNNIVEVTIPQKLKN